MLSFLWKKEFFEWSFLTITGGSALLLISEQYQREGEGGGFPLALAGLVFFLVFLSFLNTLLFPKGKSPSSSDSTFRVYGVMGATGVSLGIIPWLGMYFAGGVLHLILLLWFRVHLVYALALSVGWALLSYLIFEVALLIPIPHGTLW